MSSTPTHDHDLSPWQHSHRFDVGNRRGEARTRWVLALTIVTMVAEIAAGWWTGSMALLADGWHMGTHALALGVAAAAYALARRHAEDERFSFGTWKIEVLGSFASALVLGLVALGIVLESGLRLWRAEPIAIEGALVVAVVGLLVNLGSAWLLHGAEGHGHHHGGADGHGHGRSHGHGHEHDHAQAHRHEHEHDDDHEHAQARANARTHEHAHAHEREHAHAHEREHAHAHEREHAHEHDHDHDHDHDHEHAHAQANADAPHSHADAQARHAAAARPASAQADAPGGHDLNLRAAYVHVLADALTSLLAIGALAGALWFGWWWLDPLVGVAGAVVIAVWAVGLMRESGAVLLDREMDHPLARQIRVDIESDGDAKVADLHLWRVGRSHFAAIVSVVADAPHAPAVYRDRLAVHPEIAHLSIEVNRCPIAHGR